MVEEEGEYGVGGLSAIETLDFRRARSGAVIDEGALGEVGDLLSGGVRGRSLRFTSFSHNVGVLITATGGGVGWIPYFSRRAVY